jgi:uncharacterized protein (TIGR03067 family)
VKRLVLAALSAALALAAPHAGAAGGPEAVKKELAVLQGTWRLTALERNGEPFELPATPPRWVIKGNKVYYGGEELAVLTVEPSTTPRSVDLAFVRPKRELEAIYVVKGDTLKLCVNRQAEGVKERPLDFITKGKAGFRLLVFRRDKGDGSEGLRGYAGLALRLGPGNKGVVVAQVLDGGAAKKAGLKRGDVLVKVAGQEVTTLREVIRLIGEVQPNARLTVRIRRDGRERDVTFTVGVMPFFYLD